MAFLSSAGGPERINVTAKASAIVISLGKRGLLIRRGARA